ncbi:MAG TPA: c-type cytochrome [Actinomycetota bacterium]
MIPLAVDQRVTTALVVAGGIALFVLLLVMSASGELRGRRTAKVPPSMRPGPSDEALEKRVITNYLAWGGAATMLMALWLPAYWLREPTRLADAESRFVEREVTEGAHLYEEFQCVTCHGKAGSGGVQPLVINGVSRNMAEPPLRYIYSRYTASGRTEEEITQLIYDAINRGRPGTPMPTWSLAFGGPLNSAQIDNLVVYLQDIQEDFPAADPDAKGRELFEANCAICHNGLDDEGKATITGAGGVGPNLTVAFERLSRAEVEAVIRKGRLNTNRPSMPSWEALGDDAIEALVRFIQSIQRSS